MATYAPRHVDIWPWTANYSNVSWTPVRENASDRLGMGRAYGGDSASAEVVWQVALDAGTWTLTHIGQTNSNLGKASWYLDASLLGTWDQYGGYAINVVTQFTGITVATPGIYALKMACSGKNASSSGYYIIAQLVTLTRTGA